MTAFVLRLIALFTMLLDHIGYTFLPNQTWLRCLGRLSFPIFAFQLTEGYRHTQNKWHYALRLLAFAVLSEVPYDLMTHRVPFYPAQQNILWTFLLGVFMLHLTESVIQSRLSLFLRSIGTFFVVFFSSVTASMLGLDYGGGGILQIFAFYILRNTHIGILVICTLLINLLMGGTNIQIVGLEFPMQALAVLALVPISFSNGKKGANKKAWTWFCYTFYPAHLLVLAILRTVL